LEGRGNTFTDELNLHRQTSTKERRSLEMLDSHRGKMCSLPGLSRKNFFKQTQKNSCGAKSHLKPVEAFRVVEIRSS
jgi:hypothetical protein